MKGQELKSMSPHFLQLFENRFCKVVRLHDMKAYRGSRSIAPLILNLGTMCRWESTSCPCRFLTLGKKSRYPHKSWCLDVWEKEEYVLSLPRFEPRIVQPRAHSHYAIRVTCPSPSWVIIKKIFQTWFSLEYSESLRHLQICVAYRRGYVLRNASLGDFVVVRTSVYLHKPGYYNGVYYTPRLYGIAYCS